MPVLRLEITSYRPSSRYPLGVAVKEFRGIWMPHQVQHDKVAAIIRFLRKHTPSWLIPHFETDYKKTPHGT